MSLDSISFRNTRGMDLALDIQIISLLTMKGSVVLPRDLCRLIDVSSLSLLY